MTLRATTWQTVGPFFKIGLAWLYRENLAGDGVSGERIEIIGRVLDGDGKTVPDAVLELWQANSHGKYAHPEDEQNKTARDGIFRLRPNRNRRSRALPLHHGEAGTSSSAAIIDNDWRSIGAAASAAHQRFHLHARPSAPPRYASLLFRRARECHRFRALTS